MKKTSSIQAFSERIGIRFKDLSLLEQALTHSSYVNETKEPVADNERLEFLGDAVLELAMTTYLFTKYPEAEEGELSKLRAQYVCEQALVYYAQSIGLSHYLRLGKGEEASGGRERPAILADAFEAMLGAIYLDQGFSVAYDFLKRVVFTPIDNGFRVEFKDYKSQLQELVQADSNRSIHYKMVHEEGPAHHRIFTVEVYMDNILMGVGKGHSKKEAEQQAAKEALEKVARG